MGLRLTQGDEKRGPVQEPHSMEAPPSPLSSRPERSVVERSAVSAVLPWKSFSTREVMGRLPAQGDEKRFSSNYRRRKRRPPLCHLDRSAAQWRDLRCQRSLPGNVFRPEKSWAFGPPKAMKNGFCSATTLHGSAARPFVISTGAQRSGEICGVSGPPLGNVFRPEESWAFGPPKAMKSGSCSATTVAGSAALPFVISTEAQRSGEICGVSGPSLGRRSQGDEAVPVQQRLLLAAPPSPLSSRPERSVVERSAVSAVLPWAGEVKAMKNGSCSATTAAGSAALPFVISTGEVMGL